MRHGKTFNHLGRTSSHRKALLKNLASSLILHKRIETTVAKAKELRKYVEPLLTKSKTDSISNRRLMFAYLRDKEVVKALFGEISDKLANREGGYTRIIKLGARLGDNSEMALIELVDFNETYSKSTTSVKTKTRRSRRSGASKDVEVSGVVDAEIVSGSTVVEDTQTAKVDDNAVVEEVAAEEADLSLGSEASDATENDDSSDSKSESDKENV
jgi:large subunit ribosomal protein L17